MAAFTLNAERLIEILKKGSAGGERQGNLSRSRAEEVLSCLDAQGQEKIIELCNRTMQPWREEQKITIPHISSFLGLLCNEKPIIYKGVSYNPFVPAFGENFNLLDFFAYLKAFGSKGIVLDASKYAVINLAKQAPVMRYSKNAAVQAIDFLLNALNDFPEVCESARIRNSYLNAVCLSLFPFKEQPIVIDAEEMWKSKQYPKCLQAAIEYCAYTEKRLQEGNSLKIKRFAKYDRYGKEFQKWYTVLVLAETLYLQKEFKVNIKLGPTTESAFDSMIKKMMSERKANYGFIWYDRGNEKKLSYNDLIFFKDSKAIVRKKLENDVLHSWISEMLFPFTGRIENKNSLSCTVSGIMEKVNSVVEKNPVMPLVEGNWWMTWPPGSCD